jgi:hypothetical protein
MNKVLLRGKRVKQHITCCKSISYEKYFVVFLGFIEIFSFNLRNDCIKTFFVITIINAI